MLEASNLKTMESWYQNLSPYVNDKEFPLRGGKKDLPPVLIGLMAGLLEPNYHLQSESVLEHK